MTVVELALGVCALFVFFDYMFYHASVETTQREYEHDLLLQHHDFVSNHRNNTAKSDFIPLSFDNRHFDNVLSLCKHYKHEWLPGYYFNKHEIEAYNPRLQIQYVAFRRILRPVRPQPVRTEIIRCSNKHGIMSADNGHTGYLLEKANPSQYMDGTKFYILAKFYYIEHIEPEDLH